MKRSTAAAVLALVAVFVTAGKCDTAHPKIGSACSKPGRTSQTDGGVNVVCTAGHWQKGTGR